MFALALMLCASLDAEPRFLEAATHFRELDYERAQVLFEALADDKSLEAESARVLLWLGATRALLGDTAGARVAFHAALQRDRSSILEMRVSSKITAMLEKERRSIPPEVPAVAAQGRAAIAAPAPAPREDAAGAADLVPFDRHTPPEANMQSGDRAPPTAAPIVSPWALTSIVSGALAAAAIVPAALYAGDAAAQQGLAQDRGSSQQEAFKRNQSANQSLDAAVAFGIVSAALLLVAGASAAIALAP